MLQGESSGLVNNAQVCHACHDSHSVNEDSVTEDVRWRGDKSFASHVWHDFSTMLS